MNAKMSDRERRADDFDSIFRDRSMLGRGEWTVEELWARDAEREARAIMAETEPMGEDYYAGRTTMHAAVYMNARTLDHGTALAAAQGALIDALRSFVGEPCHCAQGLHWSPGRGYFHCAGVTPEGV